MGAAKRLKGDRHGEAGAASGEALSQADSGDFWLRCMALRPRLASYLRAMVRDGHAVDDCLQETYIVLAQRYSNATGEDLSALAFTCARHKAHGWLEKNRTNRLSIIDPAILGKIAEAAARLEEQEPLDYSTRIVALRGCLNRLSTEQRGLIEARYGGGHGASLTALAGGAGRTLDALYKQLERLRAVLKRCVSDKLARTE